MACTSTSQREVKTNEIIPTVVAAAVGMVVILVMLFLFGAAAPPLSCAEQMYKDGQGELVEAGWVCND